MTEKELSLEVEKPPFNTQTQIEENKVQSTEDKFKAIFMGTLFTIILLIISLSYGITWAVLFVIYTNNEEYSSVCQSLRKWDKSLYIVLFICAFLNLVSSIIQLISSAADKESNIAQYITFCRSCINYLAGIVILIGINVEYFNLENPSDCGNLAKLNLAFIITEWSILGFFICFILSVCILSLIIKKKKNTFE